MWGFANVFCEAAPSRLGRVRGGGGSGSDGGLGGKPRAAPRRAHQPSSSQCPRALDQIVSSLFLCHFLCGIVMMIPCQPFRFNWHRLVWSGGRRRAAVEAAVEAAAAEAVCRAVCGICRCCLSTAPHVSTALSVLRKSLAAGGRKTFSKGTHFLVVVVVASSAGIPQIMCEI